MLQGEHSAILSTSIKVQFVIKIFVLSIFEWPFYTGFTVCLYKNILAFYGLKVIFCIGVALFVDHTIDKIIFRSLVVSCFVCLAIELSNLLSRGVLRSFQHRANKTHTIIHAVPWLEFFY